MEKRSGVEIGVAEYGDVAQKLIPKKEKDSRIAELEQQLAIAENRCTTLRKQVEYMRLLYDGVEKPLESDDGDGYKFESEKRRADSHFFPERHQRVKQCITVESCYNEKYSDFNEGFVSEITGSKQHIGKDPKDVVQIILSGMTRSINDISDPEFEVSPNSKLGGAPKKCPAFTEIKKIESESSRKKSSFVSKGKGGKQYEETKSRVNKTPTKKLGKKESLAGGNKPGSKQGRSNSHKSSSMKQKKVVKPLKATKPTNYKNQIPIKQQIKEAEKVPPVSATPRIELNKRKSKMSVDAKSTYQQPTLSYRMKCVPKSFNPHFNLKSIPFVVGMSTNKSHNLGMKLQETLSLIKLNNRSGLSQTAIADPESELGSLLKYCPSTIPFNQPRSRYVVRHGSLSNMKKPGSLLQAKTSSVSMGTSVDYKNFQLRNVLVNLHDEFSRMTTKYDELKDQMKVKNDSEADKELQKLEEELTAKECEINAIMGLYNEVSDLKDKLNHMEKRSSSTSLFVGNDSFSKCVSKNGVKMTRLLRKIEEFQDGLKGNSFM